MNERQNKEFCEEARTLLTSIPDCSGDQARLCLFLSEAVSKLELVFNHAGFQFDCGHKVAMFDKQMIDGIKEKE